MNIKLSLAMFSENIRSKRLWSVFVDAAILALSLFDMDNPKKKKFCVKEALKMLDESDDESFRDSNDDRDSEYEMSDHDHGKVIGDEEGMKNRWKEYSEELYSEDKRIEKEQTDTTDFEMEPEVMEAEVEWAIKQLKDNKAPGQDGIPIELIKAGEDATIKIITKICNNIWKTGKWPEDWKDQPLYQYLKKEMQEVAITKGQ